MITIFALFLDIIFPELFNSDILKFQNQSIKYINLIVIEDNDLDEIMNRRKRKRFTKFIDYIVDKNKKDILEKENTNLDDLINNCNDDDSSISDNISDNNDSSEDDIVKDNNYKNIIEKDNNEEINKVGNSQSYITQYFSFSNS